MLPSSLSACSWAAGVSSSGEATTVAMAAAVACRWEFYEQESGERRERVAGARLLAAAHLQGVLPFRWEDAHLQGRLVRYCVHGRGISDEGQELRPELRPLLNLFSALAVTRRPATATATGSPSGGAAIATTTARRCLGKRVHN